MAKKFHQPDWKALRKLEHSLQLASFYLWDKADEAGVYAYDEDYLALDLKEEISIDRLATIPGVVKLDSGRLFLTEYIQVNYGQLKPNYNPHKPALRAIEKNQLRQISSLNQACFKLIKEEEDVIEDVIEEAREDENKGAKKNELFPAEPKPKFIIPTPEEVAAEFTKKTGNTTLAKEFAETFIAHYTNTGWTYGKAKTKMKSWQAALTSAWNTQEFINKHSNGQTRPKGRVEPSGKEFGKW